MNTQPISESHLHVDLYPTKNMKNDTVAKKIDKFSAQLIELEKIIDSDTALTTEQRQCFSQQMFCSIQSLQDIRTKLDKFDSSNHSNKYRSTLKLQALIIQYAMTISKCADTDWESFDASRTLAIDIENFIDSADCLLSLDEQRKYNITPTQRNQVWLNLFYNFAHQLIYFDVELPKDENNSWLYPRLHTLLQQGMPNKVAINIAKGQVALQLCKIAYSDKLPADEPLVSEITAFLDSVMPTSSKK